MSIISIDGNDIEYDEDLFPIYLTLYPEVGDGFRYWADGIYLSHDGKTYIESTASDSMATDYDDSSLDEADIALLDYSETSVRKCEPGNKPCGGRCIPNKWKCRLDKATGEAVGKKPRVSDALKVAAIITAVAVPVAIGAALYVKRNDIKSYVSKVGQTAAIEFTDTLVGDVAANQDFDGMRKEIPITSKLIKKGLTNAARRVRDGNLTDQGLSNYFEEKGTSTEFKLFSDNLLRNDEIRRKVVRSLEDKIHNPLPQDVSPSPQGGELLIRDLATLKNAKGVGKQAVTKASSAIKKSKLWKFLTMEIKLPEFNEGDDSSPIDIVSVVERVGAITGDMEHAGYNTALLVINTIMQEDPIGGLTLLTAIISLFPEDFDE